MVMFARRPRSGADGSPPIWEIDRKPNGRPGTREFRNFHAANRYFGRIAAQMGRRRAWGRHKRK